MTCFHNAVLNSTTLSQHMFTVRRVVVAKARVPFMRLHLYGGSVALANRFYTVVV